MKKYIQKFYNKNKKLLWLIGITISLLLIVFLLMGLFIVTRPETIIEFAANSEITQSILPFSILSFIGMVLGVVLTVLLSIMFIKMIIPDSKAFSSMLLKDEANFLLDLPKRIKKEVIDNGK